MLLLQCRRVTRDETWPVTIRFKEPDSAESYYNPRRCLQRTIDLVQDSPRRR